MREAPRLQSASAAGGGEVHIAPVVDAQCYVWLRDTTGRPWIEGMAAMAHEPEYLPDQQLNDMLAVGLDAAVLVPPGPWEGWRNDLLLGAAAHRPGRFAVMINLDPGADGLRTTLPELLDHPWTSGLRMDFMPGTRRRALLLDDQMEWLWVLLAERAVPTAVFMPGLLDRAGSIAGRHPELPIAQCHLADALLPLAALPNVAVKAIGLPMLTYDPPPYRGLWDPLRRIVDVFGSRRVWGSDHTRTERRDRDTYSVCLAMFTGALSSAFRPDDRHKIRGAAVAVWLGWAPIVATASKGPR